jgi:hypothetical protein
MPWQTPVLARGIAGGADTHLVWAAVGETAITIATVTHHTGGLGPMVLVGRGLVRLVGTGRLAGMVLGLAVVVGTGLVTMVVVVGMGVVGMAALAWGVAATRVRGVPMAVGTRGLVAGTAAAVAGMGAGTRGPGAVMAGVATAAMVGGRPWPPRQQSPRC